MLQWSRISRSFVIPQSDKIQQLSRQLQIIQIHDDLCQAPFAGNKKKQIAEPRNQGSSYNHPNGCDPKEKHCCVPQIAASLHHPDAKHLAPWHLPGSHPKRKQIFQPSIFRCELLVLGRVLDSARKVPVTSWISFSSLLGFNFTLA